MKLKNEALQILYDTIVNCTIAISPYADSPMDKAFEDCDEKLQNRIDMLQQDHESDVRVIGKLHSQMVNLEDEKTEQEKRADILKSQRDMLKKEIEQLKKDKQWLEHSRLEWARGAVKRGKEINEANEKNKDLTKQFDELKSQYQKLSIENKRLQYDYNTLHNKYSECQGTVDKQAEQIRNLKDRLNNISNACGRTQDDIYGHGYEQGQTDLWVKLQDVKDMQPNEFDTECECLGDVIDMDLEDFLDTYKKWWEQKEIDRMRDYLERFCMGRLCYNCPLHTDGFNCSRGKWMAGIPDKDVKRYYEKARGCGQYTLKDAKLFATTVEGVNRAITKACEGFCEAVKDADIKITENLRNGYTLKATVDVDKDLLMKVCGVKPEEGEPKFEYGDAVRLPWRDYDYMYIGPYEESKTLVRMFDPKMHAMVISHIGNVKYNGGKIIICDEEDLRKIWKDKK